MKQPDPFTDSKDSRIVRRPSQPRSNLERFSKGCALVGRLEEGAEMSAAGRHRVWDEVHVEVTDLLKELLGDSLVKVEREELFQANVEDGPALVRSTG